MLNKLKPIFFIAIFLTGCSSSLERIKNDTPIKPTRTEILEEYPGSRQAWVYDPSQLQDKKHGYEYFFGLSGKFKTERDARDDAYIHAVKKVVQHIGIDMKIDKEQIVRTRQKASEIIDPTIEAVEKISSLSEALVSRVKSIKWYIVKKGNYFDNSFLDSFYEARVAVEISKKHIEEIIKEKKRRDVIAKETLADKAARLVRNLAENLSPATPVPLFMGNFNYGDTDCSGPFIQGFKGLIEGKIIAHKSFLLKGKLNIKDLSGKAGLDPNLETDQAKFLKTAVLYGNYNDLERRVAVTASIVDEKGAGVSATVYIEKSKIKKDIVAKGCEENRTIISKIEPLRDSDFYLRLWTDNPGGTYKQGDEFTIYLQSSERCYVKIFNIDENGSITVIYDNTNGTKLIKNKKYDFAVKASQAGVETLIAIASTAGFPYANKVGEIIQGEEFPAIFKSFRRIKGKKAEYKTGFTIFSH